MKASPIQLARSVSEKIWKAQPWLSDQLSEIQSELVYRICIWKFSIYKTTHDSEESIVDVDHVAGSQTPVPLKNVLTNFNQPLIIDRICVACPAIRCVDATIRKSRFQFEFTARDLQMKIAMIMQLILLE